MKIVRVSCPAHRGGIDHSCSACVQASIDATLDSNPAEAAKHDHSPVSDLSASVRHSLEMVPCVYEGAIVESCTSCNKHLGELKHVRRCEHPSDVRELCVRDNDRSLLQSCSKCADREPLFLPKRHLMYHVYPLRGNGTWQRNLDQLKSRLPLFTGRKLISVAVDKLSAAFDSVRDYVNDSSCEFLEFSNDASLREVVSFVPMLEKLSSCYAGDFVFFGQAKGVTRPLGAGVTVHEWARLMYEVCLDYWPAVEAALASHPVAVPFKKVGAGFKGSRSRWHSSGSFAWFRAGDLFSRNWRAVDRQWWGVESTPGIWFAPEEAAGLLMTGTVPKLDLYKMPFFRNTVLPEYERWKAGNAGSRTRIP